MLSDETKYNTKCCKLCKDCNECNSNYPESIYNIINCYKLCKQCKECEKCKEEENYKEYEKYKQKLYRCKGCNSNLTSNNSETLYQKQKLLQNSVRVPESIYTMNLGALNVYEPSINKYEPVYISGTTYIVSPGVNWNQMSDRKQPHTQKLVTASGSTYGGNSTKRSILRLRPGAMSPGGTGVDIKHNSYYRYLARLKGKGPLRQQTVPPLLPYIPFNPAFPVYGGKVFKTGIIAQCNYKNAC